MSKKEILEIIRQMPEHVTPGQVLERLYFLQQIQKGLDDVAGGRTLAHDRVRAKMARWRKSTGR